MTNAAKNFLGFDNTRKELNSIDGIVLNDTNRMNVKEVVEKALAAGFEKQIDRTLKTIHLLWKKREVATIYSQNGEIKVDGEGLWPIYHLYEDLINNIEVINICNLTDQLFGEDWWKSNSPYSEQNKVIMKWIEENDAHYYSDPREDFFIHKGQREAFIAGKSKVVVEDLS